jgi:hypothetical protein
MQRPLAFLAGMAQTNLGYIYFLAIYPFKSDWSTRIQPITKNSHYFNSFIQQEFIIHI